MAKSVTLLFKGDVDEATIFDRLYESDSGFMPDDDQPLNSDVGIALAIAGLVVSTSQLALQIWQIWSAAKISGKPLAVTVVTKSGDRVELPLESKESVENALLAAEAENPKS